MANLKDFQEETAKHIVGLFKPDNVEIQPQDRILLADEVGLGKTIVANEVLNQLADWYTDNEKRHIKVIYICSNLSIMQQNCYKLDLYKNSKQNTSNGSGLNLSESRLSMQHLVYEETLKDNANGPQLMPMSASTSFTMAEGTGTIEERKLMYVILKDLDETFIKYSKQLEKILKMPVKGDYRWNEKGLPEDKRFEARVKACGVDSYLKKMHEDVKDALLKKTFFVQGIQDDDKKNLYYAIIYLCENTKIIWNNKKNKVIYRRIIKKLRHIFANISLSKLNPDLVVMDEFQRFKSLLNPKTEEGKMLADKFLGANYSGKIQVLLLSATPYKLYSTLEETNDSNEDHYQEFKDVMGYLIDNSTTHNKQVSKAGQNFNEIWNDYSTYLREFLSNGINYNTLLAKKDIAEEELYKHISRTERINDKYNALGNSTWDDDTNSLIDNSKAKVMDKVTEYDIVSYIEMQKLMNKLELGYFPLAYAKSAPFLMSFMNDYKVYAKIHDAFEKLGKKNKQEKKELMDKTHTLWLNYTDINRYHGIYVTGKHKENTPSNSRLEVLFKEVFYNNMPNNEQTSVEPQRNGVEKLLWLPATFPYYKTNNNEFEANRGYSKVLIFSKWAMVPRMIAGLTTYEAARLLNEDVRHLANKKMKRDANTRQYLNDTKNRGGRLSDDNNTVGSGTLIKYVSKFLARMYVPKEQYGKELDKLITEIQDKIGKSKGFSKVPIKFTPNGKLGAKNLVTLLELLDADNDKAYQYILEKNQIRDNKLDLGNNHKDKVLKLLAYIAIGGPGVCAYRIFSTNNNDMDSATQNAEDLGECLRNLFNGPFETDVVDAYCKGEDAGTYYERVLRYCVEGNLQAVLDEYAYTLGIEDKGILCTEMCKAFIKTVDIRVNVKNKPQSNKQRKGRGGKEKSEVALPTNFAVGYFDASDTKNAQRTTSIRIAFNSPFWPFVLASTSIGQEGLDFHQYCRKVMHWNLPFNPVDLEQREGRINRYLSLAIRLNLVDYYNRDHKGFVSNNIWNDVVDNAKSLKGSYSDMVPFWNLPPVCAWKYKIERIVPMYPYSQDVLRYERIMKILGLYRLTLGQERQEELVATIGHKDLDKQKQRQLLMNLAPYFKKKGRKK